MAAFFRRMMAFQRKHYTFSWLLCVAVLVGIDIPYESGILPLWAAVLLLLLMNLVTWPLFLVYREDRKACRKAHQHWPGPPRLQLLYWVPVAVTTLVPLWLLFD